MKYIFLSFLDWSIFVPIRGSSNGMNFISRLVVTVVLIATFLSSALPCGPGYISPLFDTASAPENPYSDFAAGRLGIVKPKFNRSVLYAAYRHIAGGGMSRPEQQAIIDIWRSEIDNKDFPDDTIDEVVKAWVEQRKKVELKEEKAPDIYTERAYGGYDFFPNCTKNAFETAAETLADRIASHGPSDPNVLNWVAAQDQVFENCASSKRAPDDAPVGAPVWLQKDRSYQKAAAEFYSLDYTSAKRHFAEIAQDTDSPWAETANYLVARTLIRQASLSKTPEKAAPFYDEADAHLQRFVSPSGKFGASAERLIGLIKYRRHPKERVSELAKKLTYSGNENFRQDVIDYTWLLDKFESDLLNAEEKRKEAEKTAAAGGESRRMLQEITRALAQRGITGVAASVSDGEVTISGTVPKAQVAEVMMAVAESGPKKVINNLNRDAVEPSTPIASANSNSATDVRKPSEGRKNDDDIELTLYSSDYARSWTFFIKPDANDDEAIAEAEKVVGQPINDDLKNRVRAMRQSAYSGRFTSEQKSGYEGNYWGDERLTPSLLAEHLRNDDLTDWLYTYQMPGAEAYLYSLERYKATNGVHWLMSAVTKADKSSTQLPRLLEAAANIGRSSPAFATIAFHRARILLQQGKTAEARKLLDELLGMGDDLSISARNSVMSLRLNMAETLEDFLKFSLKKPFAFDFNGDVGTIEEFIAEQKTWYDPETNTDGREAYEREVEERFRENKLWQDRLMFDDDTIEVFNQHFPTASLIDVTRSPTLPDYMRERFAIAIWTRAFLLNDTANLNKVTPELAKFRPDLAPLLEKIAAAKTPVARENAIIYFVLKTPLLSPYIETGLGKDNNEQEQWSSDDWWCEPYDSEYSEEAETSVPKGLPARPAFLTPAQSQTAQGERKRLKTIGDAPKFLAEKVMAWAKRSPADRRVPEALYIMIEANGWTKYGCGNNEELRDEMATHLKKIYPGSEWTAKLAEEERDR